MVGSISSITEGLSGVWMWRCRMPLCPYFLTHSSSSPKTATLCSASFSDQLMNESVTQYGTSVYCCSLVVTMPRILVSTASSTSSSRHAELPVVKITCQSASPSTRWQKFHISCVPGCPPGRITASRLGRTSGITLVMISNAVVLRALLSGTDWTQMRPRVVESETHSALWSTCSSRSASSAASLSASASFGSLPIAMKVPKPAEPLLRRKRSGNTPVVDFPGVNAIPRSARRDQKVHTSISTGECWCQQQKELPDACVSRKSCARCQCERLLVSRSSSTGSPLMDPNSRYPGPCGFISATRRFASVLVFFWKASEVFDARSPCLRKPSDTASLHPCPKISPLRNVRSSRIGSPSSPRSSFGASCSTISPKLNPYRRSSSTLPTSRVFCPSRLCTGMISASPPAGPPRISYAATRSSAVRQRRPLTTLQSGIQDSMAAGVSLAQTARKSTLASPYLVIHSGFSPNTLMLLPCSLFAHPSSFSDTVTGTTANVSSGRAE
mmetsp:Transcript_29653/g.71291  ORF Transcript_29653/g.71291 Transcript_29653/m.71291 type:complete len:498 (-) Transcript_29653:2086-3579(-)